MIDEDIYNAYKESVKLGQCGMLNGTETIEEFCKLLFNPEAIVYIVSNIFPSLDIVRSLDVKYDLSRFGVYVDKGNIKLDEKRKITLFGKTNADITCNELARYKVNILQGARAKVTAKGYSVVRIEHDRMSKVDYFELDNAKIIV